MPLLGEARLVLSVFWENLLSSLPRCPPGFQSTVDSFKNYTVGSNGRSGKRLSERRQSTTLDPNSKFRVFLRVPDHMTPKRTAIWQDIISDCSFLSMSRSPPNAHDITSGKDPLRTLPLASPLLPPATAQWASNKLTDTSGSQNHLMSTPDTNPEPT